MICDTMLEIEINILEIQIKGYSCVFSSKKGHITVSIHNFQVFPETLFVQLLKVMLHPDVEVRVGGHHIFSVLLIPNSNRTRHDVSNYTKRWHSNGTSTFDSVAALLEKLRREKDGAKLRNEICIQDDFKERDIEDEFHQGWARKSSPNFNKISTIIDKTPGSASLTEAVRVLYLIHFLVHYYFF